MFECVSTNDVAQRENLAVREFCNFCEYVKAGHNEQIRPARVARREQQHREESEHGIELHGAKETQIAGAMFHGEMPLHHASDACGRQNRQQPEVEL